MEISQQTNLLSGSHHGIIGTFTEKFVVSYQDIGSVGVVGGKCQDGVPTTTLIEEIVSHLKSSHILILWLLTQQSQNSLPESILLRTI